MKKKLREKVYSTNIILYKNKNLEIDIKNLKICIKKQGGGEKTLIILNKNVDWIYSKKLYSKIKKICDRGGNILSKNKLKIMKFFLLIFINILQYFSMAYLSAFFLKNDLTNNFKRVSWAISYSIIVSLIIIPLTGAEKNWKNDAFNKILNHILKGLTKKAIMKELVKKAIRDYRINEIKNFS